MTSPPLPPRDYGVLGRVLRKYPPVVLLAGFLLLTFCVPLAAHCFAYVPPSVVSACSAYYSHGPHARISTREGRTLWVGPDDFAHPESCLRNGDVIEKRRLEIRYRVNGRPEIPRDPNYDVMTYVSGLGAALLLGSLARKLWLKRRRAADEK